MELAELVGSRIWVVGASCGIGRAVAIALAKQGARVAASARRMDLLEALAAEAGPQVTPVACDVRDPDSVESCAAAARDALGGLDALVYTVGIGNLVFLRDADAETWREAFETNLMGASLVTGAAITDLERSKGRALYLSSVAAEDRPPRRGLSLYTIHKAALNRMVECWQEEEHGVSFTRVSVGDTAGTDMASNWDSELAGRYIGEWVERRFLYGRVMTPETVADHVVGLLRCDESVPVSTIVPRFPSE